MLNADSANSRKPSFVEDTASNTKISSRKISEEIQIAENIEPEIQIELIKKEIPKRDARSK